MIAIALASSFACVLGVVLFFACCVMLPCCTVINHLGGGLFILPVLIYFSPGWPSLSQMTLLFFFGAVQMALPYFLIARGLRVVSAQEAGAITLLEPLLNPLWAYLVAPDVEQPVHTMIGGAFILGGVAVALLAPEDSNERRA